MNTYPLGGSFSSEAGIDYTGLETVLAPERYRELLGRVSLNPSAANAPLEEIGATVYAAYYVTQSSARYGSETSAHDPPAAVSEDRNVA